MILIRPVLGPGTPFFEDAASRFRGALEELDFGKSGYQNIAALELLLSEARQRDAITLLSLLRRIQPSERRLGEAKGWFLNWRDIVTS